MGAYDLSTESERERAREIQDNLDDAVCLSAQLINIFQSTSSQQDYWILRLAVLSSSAYLVNFADSATTLYGYPAACEQFAKQFCNKH